jgi:parvulin-like peptidyl-prolyl isomerase
VATVNGRPITEEALRRALLAQEGPRVLVEMIDEIIIRRAAEEAAVSAAPEMVKLREENALAQSGGEAGFQAALQSAGLTPDRFRERLRLGVMLDGVVLKQMKISEAEVEAFYNQHPDRFTHGPQVRARMIMATTRENAEALKAALDAGGDFAGLARELSADPATAPQGGDMGWFERGDYAKEITDVAFSLQPGQTSEVFAGPDGFYLVRVEQTRPAGRKPLAEVREEIISALKFERLPQERQRWLVERRRQVRLGLSDPEVREAVRKLLETAPPPGTLPL